MSSSSIKKDDNNNNDYICLNVVVYIKCCSIYNIIFMCVWVSVYKSKNLSTAYETSTKFNLISWQSKASWQESNLMATTKTQITFNIYIHEEDYIYINIHTNWQTQKHINVTLIYIAISVSTFIPFY